MHSNMIQVKVVHLNLSRVLKEDVVGGVNISQLRFQKTARISYSCTCTWLSAARSKRYLSPGRRRRAKGI